MSKILIAAAAIAAAALSASSAYAIGGGPQDPEASPYAILEPQTVNPSLTLEGRSAFTGEYGVGQPRAWHGHRSHRSAPVRE